jgi:hypothetical protein
MVTFFDRMRKMVDLAAYYNKHRSGYYDKFSRELSNENYVLSDAREIIDTFRSMLKPPSANSQTETDYYAYNQNYFLLICFWLYKHGYTIDEFPNLLSRPTSLDQFAYEEIRKYLRRRDNYDGNVPWRDRRKLCDSLTIKSSGKFQDVPNEIEETIKSISTRNADFDSMEIDEKLGLLNNLIENLLKENGRFRSLEYKDVFFGYFMEDEVKKFRKKTHCFRHGDAQAVAARKEYSQQEKEFLADIGIFMAVHIHRHINNA